MITILSHLHLLIGDAVSPGFGSDEELKALFKNPLFLFIVMLLGALSSIVKQISDARRNGNNVSFADYISHWPELLVAVGTLLVAFVGLVETGTLNIASAWGLGYASNSMADVIRKGGRSGAVAASPVPGYSGDDK